MNLQRIRYASVLAVEMHFGRAAAKLHITQSALSRSIVKLEEECGLRLFNRNRSGVTLTSMGRQFISRANDLQLHARGLEHELTLWRGCDAGNVSFGIGPYPASAFLKHVLAKLIDQNPKITTQVTVNSAENLLKHLVEERVEFIVAHTRHLQLGQQFTVRPLARLKGGFFCRSRHPAARRANLKISDLKKYPILAANVPDTYQMQIRNMFGMAAHVGPPFTVACDDFMILKALTVQSDAILHSSFAAVAEECAAGTLFELKVNQLKHSASSDVDIVLLGGRSLSPVAAMIIERLIAVTVQLGVSTYHLKKGAAQ